MKRILQSHPHMNMKSSIKETNMKVLRKLYTLKTNNKIQVELEGIEIKRKKGSKEWKD